MFKRKSALLPVLVLAAATAAGCARDIDPSIYQSGAVGEAVAVRTGTVISLRPVVVRDSERLADNYVGRVAGGTVGAAGGAAIGTQIGGGVGTTFATIGGGILGGIAGELAGAAVERELTTQSGYEYVVRLATGEMVSMVQGGAPIAAGTAVYIHLANRGRGRITPV